MGDSLRRIQPGYRKPCCTEDHCEDEDTGDCSAASLCLVCGAIRSIVRGIGQASGNDDDYPLTDRTPVQRPAATNTIQREHADQGTEL